MRIDKQPIACCYLGELRQRQAFLLHDLYTQEPIVSRARGADRIESNRKMALSETSRSQQQLSISSEYQRQAPFHTRPGSISNAFNAITKVESATPSNANGYNPSIRHCSCASRSSLPQNAGSVCVWNCDTSGKKHRVWPSTMACANSSFPRVEDRSGRFSGSGRR